MKTLQKSLLKISETFTEDHLNAAKLLENYQYHESHEGIGANNLQTKNIWYPFAATTEDLDIVIKKLNPKKFAGLGATLPTTVTISENVIDCKHVANINNTVTNNIFSENTRTTSITPNIKRKGCQELKIFFEKSVEIWKLKLFFKNP